MFPVIIVLLILLTLLALLQFWLSGGRQPDYPEPKNPDIRQTFQTRPEDQPAINAVDETILAMNLKLAEKITHKDTKGARDIFDSLSDGRKYPCEFRSIKIDEIAAEWVIPPAPDHARRLLYIHGGGFQFGSPKSHRTITSKFAETTGCTVLAIDYRMLPEFHLKDANQDCRTAYQWMLENDPEGKGRAEQVFVAGDSAGGNLTLTLIAWLRDQKLPAPNAAVAFSPLTDATLSASSLRRNQETDITLKPLIAPLNKLPSVARIWLLALGNRVRPANPEYSPLLGELSNLPPTLLQASETEMLFDDSRRYFCKAYAAGSPVFLQSWTEAVHVWQMFDPQLPQARQAWLEVGKFIARNSNA